MPLLLPLALVGLLGAAVAALHDEPSLHGRFIHITDIHPDPYYTTGSRVGLGCHDHQHGSDVGAWGVDEDDPRNAGLWGTGLSDCDSPLSLMNITFDWLEKEWADKVDFVIWTGDNARHDIDRDLPRTPKEIYNLNRIVAKKMDDVFGSRGVKIVPSIGNNDIWPHNIMYPGPNDITENFLDIWSKYVPSEQTHVFERGAYYAREVIPDKLAVISLNTLYWYDSNKAVDGCPFDGKEAGSEEMDWLEVQLTIFRARSMQVWLSGHVPPSAGNYFPDCWYRFGELALRFQDTIVGSMFGHMNVDHWFMMESDALQEWKQDPEGNSFVGSYGVSVVDNTSTLATSLLSSFTYLSSSSHLASSSSLSDNLCYDDSNVAILKSRTKSGTLQGDLLRACERLPKKSKIELGDYSIINVGPSIIPTYFPSVRVFTYNMTGEPFRQNQTMFDTQVTSSSVELQGDDDDIDEDEDEDEGAALALNDEHSPQAPVFAFSDDLKKKKKKKKPHRPGDAWCRRRKHKFEPICQESKQRYIDAASPSRKNGFGSALGYSQWFMPDVNNKKKQPQYHLEYVTYHPSALIPSPNATSHLATFNPPVPYHLLPEGLLTLLPHSDFSFSDLAKKYTPYKMRDLTLPSYIRLGRRLATDKELWKAFMHNMFVSTGAEKD